MNRNGANRGTIEHTLRCIREAGERRRTALMYARLAQVVGARDGYCSLYWECRASRDGALASAQMFLSIA